MDTTKHHCDTCTCRPAPDLTATLVVTRTALVAASRRAQASATGLANVSGRFPHLGAGHVELDESEISDLIGSMNRAAS